MQETQVLSPGREEPLEKEMATHSAWEISWTEEPGSLQSVGLQKESGTTEQLDNNNNKGMSLVKER